MKHIKQTRRDFLKSVVIAGVSVYFAPLAGAGSREQDSLHKSLVSWADGSKAKFRIDAMQKVTGQKVFARDFRAKDFTHWPENQWHGYIVLCDQS